ncbi:MAG: hypothetical protein M3Q81_03180 [bacterium]|nr:hypothetical protein [bacterium]
MAEGSVSLTPEELLHRYPGALELLKFFTRCESKATKLDLYLVESGAVRQWTVGERRESQLQDVMVSKVKVIPAPAHVFHPQLLVVLERTDSKNNWTVMVPTLDLEYQFEGTVYARAPSFNLEITFC